MKLIIASQNQNKISEIKAKLPNLDIEGLDPAIFPNELLETSATLEGNAMQKAQQVYDKTGHDCFADDTGLEIEALDNEPGVLSARYAGDQRSSEDNMNLVLEKLDGKENRMARFRTVIALLLNGKQHLFEGISEGEITLQKSGEKGFGYDPIFKPNGSSKTFAEMTMEEKSEWSHRARAVEKMIRFLSV